MEDKRDQSEFIINNKRNVFYIIRDTLITLLFWILWFYLLSPLIYIGAWKFFGKNIDYNRTDAEIESIYNTLMQFFIYNGIIIPMLGFIFISWGVYNRKIYGKSNRRKSKATPIQPEELASVYNVDESYIHSCQNARYLRIYHVDKSPNKEEHAFPPLNEQLQNTSGEIVSMYFHSDWKDIRLRSNFGSIKRKKRISL